MVIITVAVSVVLTSLSSDTHARCFHSATILTVDSSDIASAAKKRHFQPQRALQNNHPRAQSLHP